MLTANAAGEVDLDLPIPVSPAGVRVFAQTLDLAACEMSAVSTLVF
ncbi:MAG: hypothetical protein AAF682_23585 [Planctomycetota bacterium]